MTTRRACLPVSQRRRLSGLYSLACGYAASHRALSWPVDANIAALHFTEVLEEKAALEVGVRVEDSVELTRGPQILILDLQRR